MILNNERLIELMETHTLNLSQVAEMIGVSRWTVRNWTRPQSTKGFRRMPDLAIKALEMSIFAMSLQEQEKPTSVDDHPDLEFVPARVIR